jgi:hypothetical protein
MSIIEEINYLAKQIIDTKQGKLIQDLKEKGLIQTPKFTLAYGPATSRSITKSHKKTKIHWLKNRV